ncbi:MAG: hypothetical protein HY300_11440 [Verrucomicrobia bacterium]|nr:hypothetical protein [Verrucomicrobiota bacterium]
MNSFFPKRAVPLLLVLSALAACHDKMTDYKQTVRSGIATLPWPKEMEAMLGEGDHFITHYGFSPGPKEWNTEIYFDGRYRFTMQVDVEIDYKKHVVEKSTSPPKFYLSEIGSLTRENGKVVGAKIADQWDLDETKWRKLVEAHGDWSAIGVPVKKGSPILGFDEYVKGWRAPRVQVK